MVRVQMVKRVKLQLMIANQYQDIMEVVIVFIRVRKIIIVMEMIQHNVEYVLLIPQPMVQLVVIR